MKPIKQNVLVKPFAADDISDGGIVVPESCKKVSNRVLVVEVGEGSLSKPMLLKKGQVAYRVKDWGTEVLIDGEQYFLMNQEAILATS